MSKMHRITLRLTEEQHNRLMEKASSTGNSVSSIIRDAVMEKVKP